MIGIRIRERSSKMGTEKNICQLELEFLWMIKGIVPLVKEREMREDEDSF